MEKAIVYDKLETSEEGAAMPYVKVLSWYHQEEP
jgi:hypothetical protein